MGKPVRRFFACKGDAKTLHSLPLRLTAMGLVVFLTGQLTGGHASGVISLPLSFSSFRMKHVKNIQKN